MVKIGTYLETFLNNKLQVLIYIPHSIKAFLFIFRIAVRSYCFEDIVSFIDFRIVFNMNPSEL